MPLRRPAVLLALAGLLGLTGLLGLAVLGLRVDPVGVAVALLGSVLLVCSSTLALNGSRPSPMPTRRALRTVLATTAANALTPAGIGGTVLTVRVHRRTGLTSEQAAAAAALRTAAGAMVATAVTAVMAGSLSSHLPLPSGPVGAAAGLVAIAALAVSTALLPRLRQLLGAARRTALAAAGVLRRPRNCLALLIGCAGVTAAQLLTLEGAVRAVGGHLGWSGLLVALLGSAAARSAVPSPGGVGPIEAALVGGLTALGMHLGAATIAVVVYRTAGHWLPVLAGTSSIRHLRRHSFL